MSWTINFHPLFLKEASSFSRKVQKALAEEIEVLESIGPQLGRPQVDTLNGSKYRNMKELRFDADNGVWRVAFAFDPTREAVLLVGGDKVNLSQKRFYKKLIKTADARFEEHLQQLKEAKQ
ncbi:MAG: type II toxin-antitoxin system RelE/ParE family toxin [Cyanobacteria bacterium J06621_3]